MEFNVFDATHCNKLLSDTIKKEHIQLVQILVAIKTVLEFPHLEFCLKKINIEELNDEITCELNSFLDADYSDNESCNCALSLKELSDTIHYHEKEFIQLFHLIFMEQNTLGQTHDFVLLTKKMIKQFITERDKACANAIHRFEVYEERKKFEEIFYRVETIL